MRVDGPVVKDVVLVGAGHAHAVVLRRFGMEPIPGVRLTLITREVHTPYSGMLPGLIAGHYAFDDVHIDCAPLARFARARLYRDTVIGVDTAGRRVLCRDRPPVPYDLVSIDVGSTPNTGSVPGADEHAIPVKPIDRFLPRFEALRQRVLDRKGRCRLALVGAGAAGVELLLAAAERLRRDVAEAGHDPAGLAFVLVSGPPVILPDFPPAMRRRFGAILGQRGIALVTGARIGRVAAGTLHAQDGRTVAADEILWTVQASAAPWLADTGLALDDDGFLRVDAALRAVGRDDVFGAGDVVAFDPRPVPKSGVYSVRAGRILAENLRRTLTGERLKTFHPQTRALYLVSTGDRHAIGTRNGLVTAGAWVWRWKDRIDRAFMRRFNELPEMAAATAAPASPLADRAALAELAAVPMRCGGCGGKVGAGVLTRALSAIEPAVRPEVVSGLNAPDDAAVVDGGGPWLSLHTVDHFRAMIDDPFLFGRIAANHALGDVYAMGGEPHTALALVTVPYGPEAKVEADLAALMTGANQALTEAGCALVGGHTAEGAELALGFAVNGAVPRDRLLRKAGLRPGDALVLTKPIGTGTLLAAAMRGRCKARWLMGAIDHMLRSNRAAAGVLAAHGVRAATDVTGFGLIGHLFEMAQASDVGAVLRLDRIPVLDGARGTVAAGILSSLQPQNLRLRRAVRNPDRAVTHPLYPLLFDPQTAGGLLAAVPADAAEGAVAALRDAGDRHAAVIGRVTPATDPVERLVLETSGR